MNAMYKYQQESSGVGDSPTAFQNSLFNLVLIYPMQKQFSE